MSSFTFNGVSSDTLGLIITQPIVRPTWAPEVEFTPIPGRPRQSPYMQTWYQNSDLPIEAVIADASPANVRSIYNALKGYGVLSISTSPQEILYAYAHLPVPEAKALLMAELPIVFECEPFANSVTESTVDFSVANPYKRVDIEGTVFCDPQITFIPNAATTSVNVNGKVITVTTPTEIVNAGYPNTYSITLDCEGELAYYTRPGGDKVACTELTSGPVPRLHTADNYITHSGCASAIMKYRERWY